MSRRDRGGIDDLPSHSDGFVRAVSHVVGGPAGRHGLRHRRLNAAAVAVLTATAVWLVGVVQKVPCRVTSVDQSVDWFARMCYSDIPLLYRGRGLALGHTPYLDSGKYPVLEYPVLTGWLLEAERRITVALGFPPSTDAQAQLTASNAFFDVNTVVLFGCLIVAVLAQRGTTEGRPWDAMMIAASPCLIATGLINWDLFPVALTAVGCLLWARRHPTGAGVLWGLAMAAKLYPVLLLGPLFVLCLRSRRMRAFGQTLLAFAAAWLVINLPVMLLAPSAWLEFWTFNADRGADLGSIWYVLQLAGHPVGHLNAVTTIALILLCAGIAMLIWMAPRRPRFGQVAYLVVFAFLVVNKVYSPQYQLWLLPLVALARPRWRDWWVFTVGEVLYVAAIWGHLGGFLTPGSGGPDRLYWVAVLLRIGTEAWVAGLVVRDVLVPHRDPVRAPGVDDPAGGVLDEADDAGWATRWRLGIRAWVDHALHPPVDDDDDVDSASTDVGRASGALAERRSRPSSDVGRASGALAERRSRPSAGTGGFDSGSPSGSPGSTGVDRAAAGDVEAGSSDERRTPRHD